MKVQDWEPKVPLKGDLVGKNQNREPQLPLKSLFRTSFGRDLGGEKVNYLEYSPSPALP